MLPNFAFTGKMGSGKSTAADYLVKNYGYTKVSFADALKKLATEACGMKEKDRKLLQNLGVGIREFEPDFWVNAAFKKIKQLHNEEVPVVIDDLRFPNELRACQQHDFRIHRIVRDRAARLKSFGMDPRKTEETEFHESEIALDSFDIQEIPSNSLEDFQGEIKRIMDKLEGVS